MRIVQSLLRRRLRLRHGDDDSDPHEPVADPAGMSVHAEDPELHLLLRANGQRQNFRRRYSLHKWVNAGKSDFGEARDSHVTKL